MINLKKDAFPLVVESMDTLKNQYILMIKLTVDGKVAMLRYIVFSDFTKNLYPMVY